MVSISFFCKCQETNPKENSFRSQAFYPYVKFCLLNIFIKININNKTE